MAFRFQKRIKVVPGIHLNLSKSGVSTSVGTNGATVNVGKDGVKGTAGIPGTGLSYQKQLGGKPAKTAPAPVPAKDWLILGLVVAVIALIVVWLI